MIIEYWYAEFAITIPHAVPWAVTIPMKLNDGEWRINCWVATNLVWKLQSLQPSDRVRSGTVPNSSAARNIPQNAALVYYVRSMDSGNNSNKFWEWKMKHLHFRVSASVNVWFEYILDHSFSRRWHPKKKTKTILINMFEPINHGGRKMECFAATKWWNMFALSYVGLQLLNIYHFPALQHCKKKPRELG